MINQKEMLKIIADNRIAWKNTAKKFVVKPNLNKKKSYVEQDAGNCWIYSVINNAYMELAIELNPSIIKKEISKLGYDVDNGQYIVNSGTIIAGYIKKKYKKDIVLQEINVLKQTKLFGKLLANGHAFVYSRLNSKAMLADIKDDDEINQVHLDNEGRHATNIAFVNKKLKEIGSRGTSRYNEFTYANTNVFIEMVKKGGISSVVYFLTDRQG